MSTVRAATYALLRAHGMTTIFGNPGSTELRLFAEFPDDVHYVLGLQESSVVAMADGYAQATGNAAFVNLHSAVGVGHAMGSIFTAMRNQAPLVITAGQQTRAMLATEPYLFAEQAAELPKPYVKWSNEPARAQDVPAAIARAYHVAMQPPWGPTFVSIPEDDWDAPAEPLEARRVRAEFAGDPVALRDVGQALGDSQRPALVVGAGVDRDGAWDLAVELAERTGATVWVSPVSSRCSFPEDHPLFGGFLVPDRAQLVKQLDGHDVVVVLGAPVFTYHVHSPGPFVAEGVAVFQLVDDPSAAARAAAGTAVLTTLRLGLQGVLDGLPEAPRPPLGAPRREPPSVPAPAQPLPAAYVLHALSERLPVDAIVVEEAPSHRNAVHDHLPIRRAGSFFVGASGGLGYALPAAVGIALARPGRRVLGLLGDGSSLYSIQALWTASQHHLPITFVILDNAGYVALEALGARLGIDRPPGVHLPGLDLVGVARGFGVQGHRVDRVDQLDGALRASFHTDGPTLLDIAVDPAIQPLY